MAVNGFFHLLEGLFSAFPANVGAWPVIEIVYGNFDMKFTVLTLAFDSMDNTFVSQHSVVGYAVFKLTHQLASAESQTLTGSGNLFRRSRGKLAVIGHQHILNNGVRGIDFGILPINQTCFFKTIDHTFRQF